MSFLWQNYLTFLFLDWPGFRNECRKTACYYTQDFWSHLSLFTKLFLLDLCYIYGRYNCVLKFTLFIFKMPAYTSLSYANNFYTENRCGGVSL